MILIALVFLPLISSLVCGIFNRYLSAKFVGIFSSFLLGLSAILSLYVFYQSMPQDYTQYIYLGSWINLGMLSVDWAIYADNLTVWMYVIICLVSSSVHIYSIGYMKGDRRFNIFISYISLFTFFMLMLVSADNLLQMFFGWEGVGLCSYLLIGFWYEKPQACAAANKAFLVNRFADLALIIGILIIYFYYYTFDFAEIAAQNAMLTQYDTAIPGFSVLDLTCLLFFIGCMGKSAQIGLHVWLPDAMEGPTPVSALIHAATMVTAGVFLVARLSFLFEQSDQISFLIVVVGSITCVFGAIIAITQTDIKKIIAYSTCSQLGYMFMACGCKAYHAAMFHLATHAFYKAALFLAAGNVIHATGEQDIYKIGNLARNMKATFAIFMIASVAIVGIPPFSGFYSKDLILQYAASNDKMIFMLGVLAAFYTGFYSSKILKNLFFSSNINTKAHEVDVLTLSSFVSLVLCSMLFGYFGTHMLRIDSQDGYFASLFEMPPVKELSFYLHYAPLLSGSIGALLGYFYVESDAPGPFMRLAKNKFHFDQIYSRFIVVPIENIALIIALLDTYVIDKFIPGAFVRQVSNLSKRISRFHSGYILDYAALILAIVLCATLLIFIK